MIEVGGEGSSCDCQSTEPQRESRRLWCTQSLRCESAKSPCAHPDESMMDIIHDRPRSACLLGDETHQGGKLNQASAFIESAIHLLTDERFRQFFEDDGITISVIQ